MAAIRCNQSLAELENTLPPVSQKGDQSAGCGGRCVEWRGACEIELVPARCDMFRLGPGP